MFSKWWSCSCFIVYVQLIFKNSTWRTARTQVELLLAFGRGQMQCHGVSFALLLIQILHQREVVQELLALLLNPWQPRRHLFRFLLVSQHHLHELLMTTWAIKYGIRVRVYLMLVVLRMELQPHDKVSFFILIDFRVAEPFHQSIRWLRHRPKPCWETLQPRWWVQCATVGNIQHSWVPQQMPMYEMLPSKKRRATWSSMESEQIWT